jgi:hypothetical protein
MYRVVRKCGATSGQVTEAAVVIVVVKMDWRVDVA